MEIPRSVVLLSLLTLGAGCTVADPPAPAPRTVPGSQRPELLTRLGDDMRRNGDATGVIGIYRAAAQAAPNNPVLLERSA
jgi:hypothetical protein